MSYRRVLFVSAVVLTASVSAYGDWTFNPTTKHWYERTSPGLTWAQADNEATALGGYLVAIGSADEDSWVFSQFGSLSQT